MVATTAAQKPEHLLYDLATRIDAALAVAQCVGAQEVTTQEPLTRATLDHIEALNEASLYLLRGAKEQAQAMWDAFDRAKGEHHE